MRPPHPRAVPAQPVLALQLVVVVVLCASYARTAAAHGLLLDPPQRGLLAGSHFAPGMRVDRNAPRDPYWHFPAGDKSAALGAGKASQERAANFRWTEWLPTRSNFRNWRAGVCGDLKSRKDHMRGGQYYYNGKITRTFVQGSTLEAKISIVAHHNGFIELHVCDIAKCKGEISEDCFRQGHCYPLKRTYERECESRYNKECGPVDPKYPGRWYLPCRTGTRFSVYGGGYRLRYQLPSNLACRHCVLHWFWSAANGCNPPGVINYFRGPRGPRWGTCKGQGGAVGGYTSKQQPCGGRKFPEEYYQCADIEIKPASGGRSARRPPKPTAKPTAKPKSVTTKSGGGGSSGGSRGGSSSSGGSGVISKVLFFADGDVRRTLYSSKTYITASRWNRFTFLVKTTRTVSKVEFFINDRRIWTDYRREYFMMGNRKTPIYWNNPILNRFFKLEVRADGARVVRFVKIKK